MNHLLGCRNEIFSFTKLEVNIKSVTVRGIWQIMLHGTSGDHDPNPVRSTCTILGLLPASERSLEYSLPHGGH